MPKLEISLSDHRLKMAEILLSRRHIPVPVRPVEWLFCLSIMIDKSELL
jgi:hypothetical protein